MNAPTTDRPSEPLRELLAGADPARAGAADRTERVWARIVEELGAHDEPTQPPEHSAPPASRRPRFARPHWQAGLLIAAAAASLALAAGTVLPGLGVRDGSGSSTSAEGAIGGDEVGQAPAAADAGRAGSNQLKGGSDSSAAADSTSGSRADVAKPADPTLVRTASVIVGTDDVNGARDRFVTTIQGLGGTLVSETVTSKGGETPVSSGASSQDQALTYPGYPSGPGIWLTVKVPAAAYDQAMTAAKSAGEVAQLQQSSYDVGAQVTDVRARIAVLTASLKRLQGMLGEATGVSDVIRLENAIADRQAELDSLLAQQRDLADQTQMSQVSLTLLSPDDALDAVDPDPQLTWWESFVQGLTQFWSWLGQALVVLSPLLIVGSVLWWVRRRRAHGTPPAAPTEDTTPGAA